MELDDSGFESESSSGGSSDSGLVGRDKWVLRSAVEEKGEEGFEPVVRRSSKRLAKKERQREIELERVKKEAQAKEETRKDSLRQHQAMAKAARGRLGGARQLGGRGSGGMTGARGKGRTAGGRGRGMHPGRGRGHSAARGGAGTSVARRPPRRITLREFVPHELEKREGKKWVLDLACENCGIAQHPTGGTIKECPVGGCHVCCPGRFESGCNYDGGKAFFLALYDELVEHNNVFQRIDPWNDWVDQVVSGLSS